MKFDAIEKQSSKFSVAWMCEWMDVSTSGFYAWRQARLKSKASNKNLELEGLIQAIYDDHRGRYGSPRVYHQLLRQGVRVGKHTVERIMREMGLVGRTRARRQQTTIVDARDEASPNLLGRDFSTTGPNQKWTTDITYIDTDEGWLYLAAIQDLFSGRIVGWAIDETMETNLCLRALQMAINQRQPPAGLLHHSDRGCQYTSKAYQEALKEHRITSSMSRKGQCWDNAPSESFFGRCKEEVLPLKRWCTRAEARESLGHYLSRYFNEKRIKRRLNYCSPIEYELRHVTASCAA